MTRARRLGATGRPAPSAARPEATRAERVLDKVTALQNAGRLDEAEQRLGRLLADEPANTEARFKLGVVLTQGRRSHEAVPHLAAALKAAPHEPRYWLGLATSLLGAGRVPDAHAILKRFTEQGFPEAQTAATRTALVANLFTEAHQHYVAERWSEAEALLDIVVLLDQGHAEAVHMAGNIAVQTGRDQLGYDLLVIAISLNPKVGGYFANLANVMCKMEHFADAIEALRKSIELDPNNAIAYSNLGVVQHKTGALAAAIGSLETALRLDPDYPRAHSNLAVVLKEVGRLDEAVAAYDRALEIDPTFALCHSNRLFAKLYANGVGPAERLADAKTFGRLIADPLLRRRPFVNDRDPERRLRIGFVSGDFREHAVNAFFEPALKAFDRGALECFAYSNNNKDDAVTARLKGTFDHWRDIRGLDEDAAANLVEADAIDILVDLAGHTAGNRLLTFARKPAPIQVGWIGYPGTTGMAAMDYRLTDRHTEPEGLGDADSVEALWRLPGVSACYQANPRCPEVVARAPFEENGYVTFGCFNRFTKVSDETLRTWAEILERVPDARLFLEIANVDATEIRTEVEARLAANGLPLDRVILEPRAPKNRYVLYNRIDAALDPFPYNGGTSSLDTLYMGVPFVALEGTHYVARMGHSILANAGLPELSAPSREAYVDLAARIGTDRDWLRSLRADLRGRMQRSIHMDNDRLAADVGAAFRGMWRRWVSENAA